MLDDWVNAVDAACRAFADPPLIAAHSLGTLAAATWLARTTSPVRGAIFVAPPNPRRADFPESAGTFALFEASELSIPSLVVASTDDPYGSFEFASVFASRMGSPMRSVGARGHINDRSDLGDWYQGLEWAAAVANGSIA